MRKILIAMLLVLIFSTNYANATIIDTESGWTHEISNSPNYGWFNFFGEPNSATVGQTFTINPGDDTYLKSIRISMMQISIFGGSDYVDFGFYVSPWSDRSTILYDSGKKSTAYWYYTGVVENFTFDINVNLSPGSYVFYASTSQYFDGLDGGCLVGKRYRTFQSDPVDAYTGGDLVYQNNGSNYAAVYTQPWITISNTDLAFRMELGQVPQEPIIPEPASMLLFGLGGIATALIDRRRKA